MAHAATLDEIAHDRGDGLAGQAAAVRGGREREPDLGDDPVGAEVDPDVADDPPGLLDGQLRPSSGGDVRGRALGRQHGHRGVGGEGQLPALEAGDLRIAAEGRERLGIGGAQ